LQRASTRKKKLKKKLKKKEEEEEEEERREVFEEEGGVQLCFPPSPSRVMGVFNFSLGLDLVKLLFS
jgi:hypothetical protein